MYAALIQSKRYNNPNDYNEYFFNRRIDKLAKAIWKYAFKVSLDPKYTKDDAMEVAINLIWNDADGMKKILSYTDEFGNTVFPR